MAITQINPVSISGPSIDLAIEKFNGQFDLPLDQTQKDFYQQQADDIASERKQIKGLNDPSGFVADQILQAITGKQTQPSPGTEPPSVLDFLKSVYSFATEFVEKPVSASLEYARGLVLGLLDAGLGSVQSIAQALANDPPDPNYRQIAVPSSETIAPNPSFAGSLGAQAATTINEEGYYV